MYNLVIQFYNTHIAIISNQHEYLRNEFEKYCVDKRYNFRWDYSSESIHYVIKQYKVNTDFEKNSFIENLIGFKIVFDYQ